MTLVLHKLLPLIVSPLGLVVALVLLSVCSDGAGRPGRGWPCCWSVRFR